MTAEYNGGGSVTKVLLCVSHCAVFLGSVKYHNVCSILYSMSLMITGQYFSVFCAEVSYMYIFLCYSVANISSHIQYCSI